MNTIYFRIILRISMSVLGVGLIVACGSNSVDQDKHSKINDKYNLLLIMDDQHRADCIGAEGSDWIHTPNLDQLANEGVLFTKAYTSTPSCLPSRAAILTGKSPWAHGMLTYTDIPESYEHEMPRMLNDAGYYTIAIGKNHFNGESPEELKKRITHGYQEMHLEEGWRTRVDTVDASNCDYGNWFYRTTKGKDLNATGLGYTDHRGGFHFLHDDSLHATNWTTNRALDFLNSEKANKPWMMKISYQRPHPPFDPIKRWLDFYEDRSIPDAEVGKWAEEKYKDLKITSVNDKPNAPSGKYPKEEILASRRTYYAAISHVDEQIGEVIKELKKKGLYENTLIVFTTDHGDQMGDHHMWRKCRPYDASSRIPFIVRWPEGLKVKAKRGTKNKSLVELRDILPTFLGVNDIALPEDMDGLNIVNLLNDSPWRETLDLEHGWTYEKDNAWVALTDGTYKYIYFTLSGNEQLFDMSNDPHEKENLLENINNTTLHKQWRQKMIAHLSERGTDWVKDGDLVVHKKSIPWRPGFPKKIEMN